MGLDDALLVRADRSVEHGLHGEGQQHRDDDAQADRGPELLARRPVLEEAQQLHTEVGGHDQWQGCDEALRQRQRHRDEAQQHEADERQGALGPLTGERGVLLARRPGHASILAHDTADRSRGPWCGGAGASPVARLCDVTTAAASAPMPAGDRAGDHVHGDPDGDPDRSVPIVVLVSGSGTLLQALIDAASAADYGVRIAAVVADRPCRGIERAERAGIPTFVCRPTDYADRAAWDVALSESVSPRARASS